MNYMQQVAKMLGVELGEKFKLKDKLGQEKSPNECYIDNDSFYSVIGKTPCLDPVSLERVLCGRYKIVKLPWKPKCWDGVWTVNTSGPPYEFTFNNSSNTHLALYKLNKLYHTREEAEAHAEEDKAYWESIRKELEE